MRNTVRVNADNERDFHPLADHMTKLKNFTKGDFAKNYIQKLHKQANMLQWILGRFDLTLSEFEMSKKIKLF